MITLRFVSPVEVDKLTLERVGTGANVHRNGKGVYLGTENVVQKFAKDNYLSYTPAMRVFYNQEEVEKTSGIHLYASVKAAGFKHTHEEFLELVDQSNLSKKEKNTARKLWGANRDGSITTVFGYQYETKIPDFEIEEVIDFHDKAGENVMLFIEAMFLKSGKKEQLEEVANTFSDKVEFAQSFEFNKNVSLHELCCFLAEVELGSSEYSESDIFEFIYYGLSGYGSPYLSSSDVSKNLIEAIDSINEIINNIDISETFNYKNLYKYLSDFYGSEDIASQIFVSVKIPMVKAESIGFKTDEGFELVVFDQSVLDTIKLTLVDEFSQNYDVDYDM